MKVSNILGAILAAYEAAEEEFVFGKSYTKFFSMSLASFEHTSRSSKL